MKYQTAASFLADYARLTERERELFRAAVRAINAAFARRTGWPPRWPAALRVKKLTGHPGIWEMTWSFASPDGRATFELVEVGGEPAIRWRRIGDHTIFRQP
ncbi:MAG: hypothetical protein HY690_09605 [Chloroflexi bacterium]|nr:hypothetical protein [Chloroflexota bacterium]